MSALETSEGEGSERLINNYVHNPYSWVERTAERFLADGRWKSKKEEELHREIEKMSAEKAKDLFNSEKDRKAWVEAIKKSVEQSIQSQVRAALGTPPGEKRKKLYEQRIAEETKRRQAKNQTFDMDREFEKDNYYYPSVHEQEDPLFQRRQQYLQKYAVRRTMRHIHDPALRSTKGLYADNFDIDSGVDPLSSEFNKRFNLYTRAALENVGKSNATTKNDVYKRSQGCVWIDRNGERHEVPGPYWPKDHLPRFSCQKHIQFIPDFVEPLNTEAENSNTANESSRGNLMYPQQWKGNCIVYERQNKGQGNSHLVPPGSPPSLVFESRFECGNLKQARRVGSYEYDLVLDCDLYTKRHTQWYYFRIHNMVSDALYTFNIINLLKRESLYNYGMKPLLYSEREVTLRGQGWKRVGSNISYYKTTSTKTPPPCHQSIYYTLSFQMEFDHAGDTCYLAHCYPYSYTDLELYLRTIVDNPRTSQHFQQEVLCKTVAGNNCYVLTITSAKVPDSEKLGVVVSARVHPGETNASWMMKGMLDFLASGHHIAEKLRRKFVFKLVPMLNPDGVIVGNYRTNLAARDLNRTYKDPRKESFPTVWHMKNMLESFKKDHQVIIYCDLHGHSRKPNVFMYGCTADPKMASMRNFIEERLFPWMMSQKAPDKFSFSGCKFRVRKCKESTARVVMWRQMGITNSFTMEATFCGANFGDVEKGRHFNVGDFEEMGRHFCEVLLEYSEAKCGNRTEMTQAFVELTCKMTREILRQTVGNYHPEGNSAANDEEITGRQTSASKSNQTGAGKDRTSHRSSLWKPRNVNDEQTTGTVAEEDHGIKVSVHSVHVESFNDCLKILENLDLADCFDESDSSDSDSDHDLEAEDKDAQGFRANSGDKKKKKKKKKKVKHWWDTLSKAQSIETSNNTTTEDEEAIKEKKTKISFGKFINPYVNRSNGGIPIFAQERIQERAKKKEDLQQKTSQDPKRKDFLVKYEEDTQNPASVLAVTDDPELNFVTAERRLAYYMVAGNHQQNPGLKAAHARNKFLPGPSKRIMEVDSFKFDYLTGGGYGFAISIPGRRPSVVQRTHSRLYTNGAEQSVHQSLQSFEEARGKPRMKQLSPVYLTSPSKERIIVLDDFSEVSSNFHTDHGRYHDNSLEEAQGVTSRHAARNARFRTGVTGSFDLEMPEQRKRFTRSRGARVTPFVSEHSDEVKSLSAGHRTKSDRPLLEPTATISTYSHVMYPLSGRKQR